MQLTVLMDNNTFVDQYYLAEPGLSYEIQTEDQHILFDAGYSDATLKNAEKMGLNWQNWKTIDYLAAQQIRHLYAAHCTDLAAKVALSSRLNVKEVGVGLALVYES